MADFAKFCKKLVKNSTIFNEKIEITKYRTARDISIITQQGLAALLIAAPRRAPPRCSRPGRLPLCPRPLRAPPPFVAPSGAFCSSCPAGPALDSSSCRFLQNLPGLRIFAKFSPLVQSTAKGHFLFSASLRTICSRPLAKLFMFT